MANSKFFGRKYRLIIKPPGGKEITFEVEDGKPAMDIKFDVTYARGQTAREGTVSILGLGQNTIHDFISLAAKDRGKALAERAQLRLEVGYFSGSGMVEVLDGFIWYATVTSPPQMWLNLKVSEYDPMGDKQIKLQSDFTNRTLAEILKALCDDIGDEVDGMGIPYTWEDKTEDEIIESDEEKVTLNVAETMALGDIMTLLNSKFSNKASFILNTTNSDGCRKIICLDKDLKKATRGEIPVDNDHGLLSVTGIDAVSGCITTFIDGSCTDELSHLNLHSELNQQANGRYFIIKKQYVGHFMGQEWYTRYFCSAREDD